MKSKEDGNKYISSVGSDNMLNVEKTYPYSLVELCDSGKSVGKLIIDKKGGKLRFEGDVDKSAQIFLMKSLRDMLRYIYEYCNRTPRQI